MGLLHLEAFFRRDKPSPPFRERHVAQPPALLAHEMRMGDGDPVETYFLLVDGQHLHGPVLRKEPQSVVHRCLRQRGNHLAQSHIDFFHGGVRMVFQYIIHYRNALHRRVNLVMLQSFQSVPVSHPPYKFVMFTMQI